MVKLLAKMDGVIRICPIPVITPDIHGRQRLVVYSLAMDARTALEGFRLLKQL